MQCTKNSMNLFWFRRDLRIIDNTGLNESLKNGNTICCFIWDKNILKHLDVDNSRVHFIYESVLELKQQLINYGSDLLVLYGDPLEEILKISKLYNIENLYYNNDYEPLALKRDANICNYLSKHNIKSYSFKDQVIFEKNEILNLQHKPYTVYSHYKKTWLNKLYNLDLSIPQENILLKNLLKLKPQDKYYSPFETDFIINKQMTGGEKAAQARFNNFSDNIDLYHETRNIPSLESTSSLGVDLRFGTISIRQLVQFAMSKQTEGASIWLSELIWRDFFSQILYNFPHVVNKPFHLKYEHIQYENNFELFTKWCNGETGYPIVDAGMRQLNQTGFMHNRVRMICASFLCKDLLIDWRWGEKYFARKLIDYDLASNNGNWQWCASTGCDAQPYFRIFNPYNQSEKFDPDGIYIKKYIPELLHLSGKNIHNPELNEFFNDYTSPIVNHKQQIEKAKAMFK